MAPSKLQAFATVQPCAMRQFDLGYSVPFAVFADRRSASNHKGKWLQGRLDYSLTPLCFHFNERRLEGWHYDWKSGATAIQRLEMHQLCVVSPNVYDPSTCTVVASAFSTPFQLGSYRRALFPPGKSLVVSSPAIPPMDATSHPSSPAILYDLHHSCRSLNICDYPNEWRLFEQSLIREFQEWFKIDLSHTALVAFDGREQTILGDFQGSRKATLKLLRWWISPSNQHAMSIFLHGLMADESTPSIDGAFEKWSHFLKARLDRVEPKFGNQTSSSQENDLQLFTKLWRTAIEKSSIDRPLSTEQNGLNGEWMAGLNHSEIRLHSAGISFLGMSQALTMMFGLRINLVKDILQMQSIIQRIPANPTTFILDSVPRQFETLPNGESLQSFDPSLLLGDYIGWIEGDTLQLWLYGWPKQSGEIRYVLHIRVNLLPDDHLVVESTLETCTYETPVDFDAQSPDERIFRSDSMALEKFMEATICYHRHAIVENNQLTSCIEPCKISKDVQSILVL
ncbi:hypothetical protein LEN26_017519 [Aphanomyces euteiches]|nr:hypothetical protein LEN26_017519 [Aphanomyces euteiches]KAH9111759.1 hypothetical protein AeMF1_013799 [Aphanomyces euteiches]KAH9183376.1 hypothetical protein AeNC1_014649 [Aphanomyces euteiches]